MTARPRSKPRSTASASARSKPRSSGSSANSKATSSGNEFVLTALGCLWILLAVPLIAVCGGVYYGSTLAVNVLKEIGAHDYAGPRARIQRYANFFASLDSNIYQADQRQQNVDQGKVSVSWVVTLRGSQERRRFEWQYDLQSYTVVPRTNAALCLDVELGLIPESEALVYGNLESEEAQYDPNDLIVRSIVKSNYSLAQVQDMASGWQVPTEEPVGAPLISAQAGVERQGGKSAEEEEQQEQDEQEEPEDIEGEETQPEAPSDATSVIDQNENEDDSGNE